MKQNKKIAITGGIGSGKSAISQILASKGYFVLDCDQITKQLYQKQKTVEQIAQNFGGEFVCDGKVDTKKLPPLENVDIMREEFIQAEVNDPAVKLAKIFLINKISQMIITDGDGKPVGMVTLKNFSAKLFWD